MVLTAPCGSGKFATADLGVDVMRKVTGIEDGLGIGLLPLSSIMVEMQKNRSDIAFLTMEGQIQVNDDDMRPVILSDTTENIVKSGKYKLILGTT